MTARTVCGCTSPSVALPSHDPAIVAECERMERELIGKLLDSDNPLATLNSEIKRKKAELAIVKGARDQYMNRCNELVRRLKMMGRNKR